MSVNTIIETEEDIVMGTPPEITEAAEVATANSLPELYKYLMTPYLLLLAPGNTFCKLLEPYNYIGQFPWENINLKLSRAFNHWLNIPEDKLKQIDKIVKIQLDASFLIDDIQDKSIVRRGVTTAHLVYGVANTINAAYYAWFISLEECSKWGHPDALIICLEQNLELYRGQGIEIYWRDNFNCPSEDEYIEMAKKKSALFMLAVRLMQLFSESKQDYTVLTDILGLYFQMRDDYMSLFSEEYMKIKGYCDDITEGKFSFPLVHAIQKNPNDKQVINILKQRTTDTVVKKHCLSLLEKYGSHEYTRKKLAALSNEAKKEIKRLGGNPDLEQFLDFMENKI